MMDDNLLSQDDIDALMRQMTGEIEQKEETLVDENRVRPFVRVIAENAGSTLSTLLQRNTDVVHDALKPGKSVVDTDLHDHLLAQISFGKDFDGDLYLAVPKTLTAMMADLMLMGDGNAMYEDDHKDALCEIINNIMGGVNTRMGEEHHTALSVSQATVNEFDPGSSPFNDSGTAFDRLEFHIEGMKGGPVHLLLSKSLYESVRKFFATGQEAPAPAPTPVAAPAAPAPAAVAAEFPAAPAPVAAPPSAPPPAEPSAPVAASEGGGAGVPRGLGGSVFASSGNRVLDLLLDIPLNITIELGRTRMSIRKILEMGPGSIIEMERLIQEPVDLLVNDKVVAKGEVVVVDENFGIRIISLVTPEERIKFLK